jgi:hypothetical protein
MMEALSSSETSVVARATWRNIPEDAILQSHRSENLESYWTRNVHSTYITDISDPEMHNGPRSILSKVFSSTTLQYHVIIP